MTKSTRHRTYLNMSVTIVVLLAMGILAVVAQGRPAYAASTVTINGATTFQTIEDRKSTRLNSSHTVIYTLSLHDALPICRVAGYGHTRGSRAGTPGIRSLNRNDQRRDHLSDD